MWGQEKITCHSKKLSVCPQSVITCLIVVDVRRAYDAISCVSSQTLHSVALAPVGKQILDFGFRLFLRGFAFNRILRCPENCLAGRNQAPVVLNFLSDRSQAAISGFSQAAHKDNGLFLVYVSGLSDTVPLSMEVPMR